MYDGLRDQRRWVLPEVLAYQAATRGEARFVTTTDGEGLSFAEMAAQADRVAGFLAGLGVAPGDRVAAMLPNGLDFLRAWLGVARLGAIFVPINTDLKGAFLRHQLDNAESAVAIVDAGYVATLEAVAPELPALRRLIVAGGPVAPAAAPPQLAFDGWREAAPHAGPLPAPSDIACIMYTSGTTGPSKGVLMPHAHCYLFGLGTIDHIALEQGDRYYVVLPLFHANGLFIQVGAVLIAGAQAILRPRFSAGAWLDDVRRHGATVTNTLGAVSAFVLAQPPSRHDRDHALRAVMVVPNPSEHDRLWRERFGVAEVLSGFGMTECNIPVYCRVGATRPGVAGLVYERYFEVEIRDPDTDAPVPPGSIGEIMVRPKLPWGFMAGYHRMPDKTVEAWRNFWFHTGDAGTMDAEGWFSFRDRIKDCIRRRGENISSFEVEAAIARLPGVKEVAAVAVPSNIVGGEDEVMLLVVPTEGVALNPASIAAHAERELPRFAQPRFIELVADLPKTPTAKVQKALLRQRGASSAAWDRENPG